MDRNPQPQLLTHHLTAATHHQYDSGATPRDRHTTAPQRSQLQRQRRPVCRLQTADCRLADCANTTPTPRPTATTEQQRHDDVTTNLTPTQICTGHRADQLSGVC